MDYSAPSIITLTSHLLFVVCLTVTINGGGGLSANSSRQQFYDLADFPLHSIIPFRDPYYASDNYWHSRGPVPPPATAQFKIRTNEYRQQQLESSFSAAAAAAAVAETRQGAAFGGGNKGFGTLTLTLGSTYSTFTVTTTTTCTTSTANIKVCSPSKGRRRRSNFGIHRLMFDEEEFDESAIFAPRKTEDDQLQRKRTGSSSSLNSAEIESTPEPIPFIVQPGFNAPGGTAGVGQGRFFIAFASSTLTTTSTSTYFYILTATCKSTTWYQSCGTGYTNLVGPGK